MLEFVGSRMTSSVWSQHSFVARTAISIRVKVNRIGSLTETLDAVELAQMNSSSLQRN